MNLKKWAIKTLFLLMLLASLFVIPFSSQALAGFQWSPSPSTAQKPKMHAPKNKAPAKPRLQIRRPQATKPPKDTGIPLVINPFPEKDLTKHEEKKPAQQPASLEPREYSSVINSAATSQFELVNGFGSDLPLALALRQVVPPEYGFAFGEDVNPGYRVSWTGGKPWNEVVQDMVTPLGLHVRVRGNKISIQKEQHSALAAPQVSGGNMIPSPLIQSNNDTQATVQPMKIINQRHVSAEERLERMNITDPGEKPSTQPFTYDDQSWSVGQISKGG